MPSIRTTYETRKRTRIVRSNGTKNTPSVSPYISTWGTTVSHRTFFQVIGTTTFASVVRFIANLPIVGAGYIIPRRRGTIGKKTANADNPCRNSGSGCAVDARESRVDPGRGMPGLPDGMFRNTRLPGHHAPLVRRSGPAPDPAPRTVIGTLKERRSNDDLAKIGPP